MRCIRSSCVRQTASVASLLYVPRQTRQRLWWSSAASMRLYCATRTDLAGCLKRVVQHLGTEGIFTVLTVQSARVRLAHASASMAPRRSALTCQGTRIKFTAQTAPCIHATQEPKIALTIHLRYANLEK